MTAWSIALALRNTAQVLSSPSLSQVAQFDSPPPTASPLAASEEMEDEVADLRDEAKGLRQDIRTLRHEAEEELATHAPQVEKARQRRENKLEPEEWFARLTSPDATEEQKRYYARRQNSVRDAAQKRIRNRQLILSHLEDADITQEQLEQIREWFAQLDAFDAEADYRFYYRDMHSLMLDEMADTNFVLRHELRQLIRDTLTDEKARRQTSVEHAFSQNVPGSFVFTIEDVVKLSSHW
ncbi:MAG: hypothetical protein J5654_08630 [Victivallales bacterium]|nr:hypothetical protein [Victivallales bacterium]